MTIHLYLSPHLDDAVLSCGGRIHQQNARGQQVLIVTVCAGDPPPGGLSPFARSLHARWGTPQQAVRARREEDRAAGTAVGARMMHLGFRDAVYRTDEAGQPLYASEEAIFGPVHPAEFGLVKEIARAVQEVIPPGAEVYVPLGAGHHVDHTLTRKAAERLPQRLVYYEDTPYAAEYGAVELALAGADWEAETVTISEADFRARVEAVARYRSQISTFWADLQAMRAALREFALKTGNRERLAERYWRRY